MPRLRRSCRTTARTAADAGRAPRSGSPGFEAPDRGRNPRHPAGSHNRSRHRLPRVPRHPRIGGATRGIPPPHTTDRDTDSRQAGGTRESGSRSAASRLLKQPIATPNPTSPAAPANPGRNPRHPATQHNQSRHQLPPGTRPPQIGGAIRGIPPAHATATPTPTSPTAPANRGRDPRHPAGSHNRSRHRFPRGAPATGQGRRVWKRSPEALKMLNTSAVPSAVALIECGRRVSNSAASPGVSTCSLPSRANRTRPLST
ncbi:hypothetical protein DEU37_0492 [Microbacterium sp. AG790]|nr:hypothetical protein DEU37_0492 [Microbacterium sp. AG790]